MGLWNGFSRKPTAADQPSAEDSGGKTTGSGKFPPFFFQRPSNEDGTLQLPGDPLKTPYTLRKTKAKDKKKRPPPPVSVQQLIHYRRMFEDGVCEVEEGMYSKTVQISDINYQTSGRDEQIGFFSKYCEVLNYFSETTGYQLSVFNRRIDSETFRREMLYGLAGDDVDQYRAEMNDMISEKALQGDNDIIRGKYITFSVQAESYREAVTALTRIEADLTANLRTLGCIAHGLTGRERLELIHYLFRPKDKFNFDYRQLLESGLSTKDAVAPDSFNFEPRNIFGYGSHVGQVLYLKDLPSDLSDKLITELSEVPADMIITQHIAAMDNQLAEELVKRKISMMENQKVAELKKAHKAGYGEEMLPIELKYALQEAYDLLDAIKTKNQRLFRTTFLVFVFSGNLDTLKENVLRLMAVARQNNCKLGGLDYMQREGMNSTLPVGKNHVEIQRTLTTASTAIFIPFTTQEIVQPGGIYYGQNHITGGVVVCDRKALMAANGLIFGTPGSGKSFMAKQEIINVLLNDPDAEVLVIDPEREFSLLARAFGGEIVRVSAGSKAHINPMDITAFYADEEDPIKLKSEFILSLCELMLGKERMTASQRSLVDRACALSYAEYFQNPAKKPMPTLQDFYAILKNMPEPEAKNLALSMELFTQGSLSVFANPTNVSINNRFVVFDVKDLGTQLRTLGMLVVLDQVWNRITRNREQKRRTWIYIDEFQLFMQNEYSAEFFSQLWSRARKWGAIPTAITQNIRRVLESPQAKFIFDLSSFVAMLNQSANDKKELAELLNISEPQQGYITNTGEGGGLIWFQGAIVPFSNKFPTSTKLYKIMSTKVTDV